jgi:hypothetical protein
MMHGIVTNALGRFLARIKPLLSKKKCEYLICENTDMLSEDIISRNKCEYTRRTFSGTRKVKAALRKSIFTSASISSLLSCDEIP